MHETSPPPNDPAGFDVSHREVTSGVALIRVQPAKHMLVGFCVSHRTLFIATPPGLVVRFDADLDAYVESKTLLHVYIDAQDHNIHSPSLLPTVELD
jgi:hypothetical protein